MKLTNNFNLPKSFEDVVKSLVYDPTESDPTRIGVTTLINPPRIKLLTTRHWNELTEDISDHIWRIIGNATHWVLEKAEHPDRLIEEKLEKKIDGVTLVGKLDIYEKELKSVEDLKITSVWAIKIEEKKDWNNQLNCYSWFLRDNGFEVNKAFINAIIRDWRRNESKKYQDYPHIPFVRKEIELWSFEKQEAYIKNRIKEYKVALNLADDELPECSAEDRWYRGEAFAVYKNSNKTATRLLETAEEAEKFIKDIGTTKDKYRIQKRPGEDFRCLNYCLCAHKCNFFKEKYGDKCLKNV